MELMGSSVRMLAAGRRHSVALLPQRVLAWGAGSMGQLGLGTVHDKIASPTSVDTLKVSKCAFVSVSCERVALLPQRMLAWGAGSMGQLGVGTGQDKIASPSW